MTKPLKIPLEQFWVKQIILVTLVFSTLCIMGYNHWHKNWGNSTINWGNGKGKGRAKNWSQSQGYNALQRNSSVGAGSRGAAPGANTAPVAQAPTARAKNAEGGIGGAATVAPMAAMDQATLNHMLSRNERFTSMQDDAASVRPSVTSLNQGVQRQFHSIQASQSNGFCGDDLANSDDDELTWSIFDTGGTHTAHARMSQPSASSGTISDPGGAPLGRSLVPNDAPSIIPTAGPDDGVHLDPKGDITAKQHDRITDILGIHVGSVRASKARPNGYCAVADWWSEFQKTRKLPEWQSLLKDMGIAAEAADEVGCLDDVLRYLIDALDTLKACKKPRRSS